MRRLPGFTQLELEQQLSDLYAHTCCGHDHDFNDLADNKDLEALHVQIVMDIWKRKQMPQQLNSGMVKYYGGHLMSGIEKGYGEKLSTVDFDTPDFVMLRKLQDSVFHFSAAKNYQQLKALSQALVNDKGKLRTFSEFKDEATKINQEHSGRWLKAEYEQAVATAQMASTWTRFKENAQELPLLKFDAVNDERTSPVCKELDGVIKPINDAFWSIYYPPNHWGCRSDVQQVAQGIITPSDKIVTPEKMPEMFKTNLAENGLAFPKSHPYFKDNPNFVKEQGEAAIGHQPAHTIKEATARIKASGVEYVNFGNSHISHYNATLEALETMPKKAVPDFVGTGAEVVNASGKKIARKASEWYGVSMATPEIRIGEKLLHVDEGMYQLVGINTRQYKTLQDITAQKEKIQALYVKKFGRKYFFNTDGRLTHFHEFGHVADNALANHSGSLEWKGLAEKWYNEEKMYDVLKSPSEAFAEAMADLYGNDGDRLPDYIKNHLLKLFQ